MFKMQYNSVSFYTHLFGASYAPTNMLKLGVKRREIICAFKEFIFYYEKREISNIIITCNKCKERMYPELYGNKKVKHLRKIGDVLFKTFPSCSPVFTDYELPVKLHFSLEETGSSFESFS